MATSGTVGSRTFPLAKLMELGMARCQMNPSLQTPEIVDRIKAGLYMALTSMASRGYNLWRIEHAFLGLAAGVNRYDLPAGSVAIANLNFVTNTLAASTMSVVTGGYQAELTDAVTTTRFGFKPTVDFTAALSFLSSTDGVLYTLQDTRPSATYEAGVWYWFDLPTYELIKGVRVTSATSFTLTDLQVSQSNFITPMTQWNRDDYSQQPQRTQQGRPSTNFYFDRQLFPQIWVWPNVREETDHLEYWIQRHIEDIVSLQQEVEVPTHWLNATVWMIAREFSFIMPGMDPTVKASVLQESDRIMNEAEMGESDGSSLYLAPNIRGYNR